MISREDVEKLKFGDILYFKTGKPVIFCEKHQHYDNDVLVLAQGATGRSSVPLQNLHLEKPKKMKKKKLIGWITVDKLLDLWETDKFKETINLFFHNKPVDREVREIIIRLEIEEDLL